MHSINESLFTFFLSGETSDEVTAPFSNDSVTLWDLFGVDFEDFSLLSPSLSVVSSTDLDFGFYKIKVAPIIQIFHLHIFIYAIVALFMDNGKL